MPIFKDFKFWLLASIGCIYIYLIYSFRWISSDGLSVVYQSYNVINGLGLVWNLGERTYVSTSPLFTLISIPLTYILDLFLDLFDIPVNKISKIPIIINSIFAIASFITVLIFLFRKIKKFSTEKIIITIIAFSLLLCSRFYIDFSTSGLENSLSYFLISLFTISVLNENVSKGGLSLPILASLVFLTRYDFLLIVLPSILFYIYKNKITKGSILMCVIIMSWFIFSLLYFGSIFPNSFYLKTNNFDFSQSFYYFKQNLFESKPMFLLIFIGLYCSFIINKRIFLGVISYLIYIFIVRDYMFGRLFTPLVPLSIIVIISFISTSTFEKHRKHFIKFAGIFLALFIILFYFPSVNKLYNNEIIKGRFRLSDERIYYTKVQNFLTKNFIYTKPSENPKFINNDVQMLHTPLLAENKNAYFLDPIGLANPFVTYYIKNYGNHGSRPGHYYTDLEHLRKVGVYDAIITKKNHITDKNIAELYDDINLVSKGDIFDMKRIKKIIKLNTHKYNNTVLK